MNYDEAFEKVIGHEGGYVNHPADPGGETKYGVTDRADGKVDGYIDIDGDGVGDVPVKQLTLEDAKIIYKRDYWDKCRAEHLPPEIRYAHFDMAVNAGIGAAAKNLQRAAGVTVDGAIGPQTLQAAMKVTIGDYMFYRAVHYMRITARNPKLTKFGKGWANRIEHIYKESKS